MLQTNRFRRDKIFIKRTTDGVGTSGEGGGNDQDQPKDNQANQDCPEECRLGFLAEIWNIPRHTLGRIEVIKHTERE